MYGCKLVKEKSPCHFQSVLYTVCSLYKFSISSNIGWLWNYMEERLEIKVNYM